MGTQPESKLSRDIMTALRNRGAYCHKNHGGSTTMAGIPDIEGCYRGWYFGIETKMPGKLDTVSPVQRLRHREIEAAGGMVIVVTSVAEAVAFVTGLPGTPDHTPNGSAAI